MVMNIVIFDDPFTQGTGRVVDILEANRVPDPVLVRKYYSSNGETDEAKFKSAFKATKAERLVIERDDGGFVIIPMVDQNVDHLINFRENRIYVKSDGWLECGVFSTWYELNEKRNKLKNLLS